MTRDIIPQPSALIHLHHPSAIIHHPYPRFFHYQSYGHTFPIPNEPAKSKVHQIPSHPAMICSIELPHSFSLFTVPDSFTIEFLLVKFAAISWQLILSRMLRYYRNAYSYWFFLLYCSVNSRSFLNFSTLSAFIFPTLRAFLLAFTQFRWSCSSILCFDGFRLLASIKPTTSSYRFCQRSSCVISVSEFTPLFISDLCRIHSYTSFLNCLSE